MDFIYLCMNLSKLIKIADKQEYVIFYDQRGDARLYLDSDGVSIYTLQGNPVGYLYNDTFYSYEGILLGHFVDNWLVDTSGYYLLFTKNSKGGPYVPSPKIMTATFIKLVPTIKQIKRIKIALPILNSTWSSVKIEDFIK